MVMPAEYVAQNRLLLVSLRLLHLVLLRLLLLVMIILLLCLNDNEPSLLALSGWLCLVDVVVILKLDLKGFVSDILFRGIKHRFL